jgi:predicted transcriptional regulator of viral defense system
MLRPRDLKARNLPPEYLWRLEQSGLAQRTERGLYVPTDVEVSEQHQLVAAAVRVPQGIVCLLSALRFHDLTTQNPFEIWLALPPGARHPRTSILPLHIVRFSGQALSAGIEEHIVDGVIVRVYTPAKTVADCFKYRNKIGLDVALEALRETWRARRATMDELWHYAAICRVTNVMRPYLESLVTLVE